MTFTTWASTLSRSAPPRHRHRRRRSPDQPLSRPEPATVTVTTAKGATAAVATTRNPEQALFASRRAGRHRRRPAPAVNDSRDDRRPAPEGGGGRRRGGCRRESRPAVRGAGQGGSRALPCSCVTARKPRTRPSSRSSRRIAACCEGPFPTTRLPGSRRSHGTSAFRACGGNGRSYVAPRERPIRSTFRPCRSRRPARRDRSAAQAAIAACRRLNARRSSWGLPLGSPIARCRSPWESRARPSSPYCSRAGNGCRSDCASFTPPPVSPPCRSRSGMRSHGSCQASRAVWPARAPQRQERGSPRSSFQPSPSTRRRASWRRAAMAPLETGAPPPGTTATTRRAEAVTSEVGSDCRLDHLTGDRDDDDPDDDDVDRVRSRWRLRKHLRRRWPRWRARQRFAYHHRIRWRPWRHRQ